MWRHWAKIVGLFLFISGTVTLTINANNAYSFRLQNATVSALSTRQTFTLKELEVPDFRLIVGEETFRISEDIYPMKQPGQTIAGAGVYSLLKRNGISYQDQYLRASSLVTMGTSAVLAGLMAVLMFRLTWKKTGKEWIGWTTALILIWGTIIGPYAGVTHHDIFGVFFTLLAITLFAQEEQGKGRWGETGAGMAAGLSIFFTMLTLPVLAAVLLAAKHRVRALSGAILGLTPTLLFNLLLFGKPWLVANLAGKVSDTVPLLSLSNLAEKLWFYLGNPATAWWSFMPVLLWGLLGMVKAGKTSTGKLLWLMVLGQLLYISSIETFGGHQYGPRYLLPAIPAVVVGIGTWLKAPHPSWQRGLFWVTAGYSLVVSVIGAVQTVMYPLFEGYAPYRLMLKIMAGEIPTMRVWKYGAVMSLLGVGAIAAGFLKARKVRVKG